MTVKIDIEDNLVDRIGEELAHVQDLIGTIESARNKLEYRLERLDGFHEALLHAEAEALDEKAEDAVFLEIRQAEEKLRKLKEAYGQ
jgi:hypothetical protein